MMLSIMATLMLVSAQGPGDRMLVSTAWLGDHLGDRNLVLLHVGDRAEFDAEHVPGAQYITLRDVATPPGSVPPLELPPVAMLDSVLEARGVSDDSRIVIYWGKDWFTPAARVYFTLYWAGLGDRASVLAGGMPQWKQEGRAVTNEVRPVTPGSLTLRPQGDLVVDAPWVAGHANRDDVTIIDARTPLFYLGTDTTYTRPGHIPGARNIPFSTVVAEPHLVPPDSLRALFAAAGVKPGNVAVTYCHIGQQASLVWFAARLLGYDARLYDGSFREWDTLKQYPVERGR